MRRAFALAFVMAALAGCDSEAPQDPTAVETEIPEELKQEPLPPQPAGEAGIGGGKGRDGENGENGRRESQGRSFRDGAARQRLMPPGSVGTSSAAKP